MSNFQIILLAVLIFIVILAVLIFAGFIPLGGDKAVITGKVTIWGILPQRDLAGVIDQFNVKNRNLSLSYVEKNADNFNEELAQAMAEGRGPDLFIMPSDSILKNKSKIFVIPYANYPERTFKETFLSIGELNLTPEGILALPWLVDPLVMYWNRSLFDSAGIAEPPKLWKEVPAIAETITTKTNSTINLSAVALGGSSNINNIKEILSALFLQLGDSIVSFTERGYKTGLENSSDALSFYTNFANPTAAEYSWNESLPESRNAFLSGDLAIYFGLASELFRIRDGNPNLDFDVTDLPQSSDKLNITFAKVYGLAVAKNSPNISATAAVAFGLTTPDFAASLSSALSLPPARRDLLSQAPTGHYMPIFYRGALRGRGWLDPDPKKTDEIFKRMVGEVTSGRLGISEALGDAEDATAILLPEI